MNPTLAIAERMSQRCLKSSDYIPCAVVARNKRNSYPIPSPCCRSLKIVI